MATVLVVGSGGREMAQAMTLAKSPLVAKVIVAPGNGGNASCSPKISNVAIKDSELEKLVEFAAAENVELVAVGPEAPLCAGLADKCAAAGIACFGPTAAAARLEGSKAWMKDFFVKYNLPTARHNTFTDFAAAKAHVEAIDYAVVCKTSGLAAGKGVLMPDGTVAGTIANLETIMVKKEFGSAGDKCVVEELLDGPECSVLAFCDGKTAVCMPGAQDHKRALDGDLGLNTGGMGAYAPCPCLTAELAAQVDKIVKDTVTALAKEGAPYIGVLFAGLMLTKDGPKLLEYNCRMGDPETQVVLPLLQSDLYTIMSACTTGTLDEQKIEWSTDAAATVVLAAAGYPASYDKGMPISGCGDAGALDGVTVFHAGTALKDDVLVTSGGRVLAVTGVAATLSEAVKKAYSGVDKIAFDPASGKQYRTDIAAKASQGVAGAGLFACCKDANGGDAPPPAL